MITTTKYKTAPSANGAKPLFDVYNSYSCEDVHFLGSVSDPDMPANKSGIDLWVAFDTTEGSSKFELMATTRDGYDTVGREHALVWLDCDLIEKALESKDSSNLDALNTAAVYAIQSGLLDAPKEFIFGNSYIKDHEYREANGYGDVYSKLPDFYRYKDEEEAKSYSDNNAGTYLVSKALNAHHLQAIAACKRLDLQLEKERGEFFEPKNLKYQELKERLFSKYVVENKAETIELLKMACRNCIREYASIDTFVADALEDLVKNTEAVDSIYSENLSHHATYTYNEDKCDSQVSLYELPQLEHLITDDFKANFIVKHLSSEITSNISYFADYGKFEGELKDMPRDQLYADESKEKEVLSALLKEYAPNSKKQLSVSLER
ncbi:hypothetical protein AB4254_12155 [Vibrio breoganii]